MSARQVLALTDALMRDPDVGFVAALRALLGEAPPAMPLQAETQISRRKAGVSMAAPALGPRLALTLRAGSADTAPNQMRDGVVRLDARYETFEADEEILELQVAYASSALSRVVLNHLREYSDAHNGTVVEVTGTLDFNYGVFEGPVSAGFIASITILERSSE